MTWIIWYTIKLLCLTRVSRAVKQYFNINLYNCERNFSYEVAYGGLQFTTRVLCNYSVATPDWSTHTGTLLIKPATRTLVHQVNSIIILNCPETSHYSLPTIHVTSAISKYRNRYAPFTARRLPTGYLTSITDIRAMADSHLLVTTSDSVWKNNINFSEILICNLILIA